MTDIFGGRTIFLEHAGGVFELPRGHSLTIGEPDESGGKLVSLAAGSSGGGVFELRGLKENEDQVTVMLGRELGRTGGAQVLCPGDEMPAEISGYPFPAG